MDTRAGKPLITLWHGTAGGPDDATLRAIAENGLTKDFSRPRVMGQTPGVFFSLSREYAIARALRCVGKLQRGGRPLLMGIETDLDPATWDWDFEVSRDSAAQMLSEIKPLETLSSGVIGYAPWDYRFGVRNTELHAINLRTTGHGQTYARHFNRAAAALITAPPGADVAFKYTGSTPLRVKTVEFI